MSTDKQYELTVSDRERELLKAAIEAGGVALAALKQSEDAEHQLRELEEAVQRADAEFEHCEPEDERDCRRACAHASQQLTHGQRTLNEVIDNGPFTLDMFRQAIYDLEQLCRETGNECLRHELRSAESRLYQPDPEGTDSWDFNERLKAMIEFLSSDLASEEADRIRTNLVGRARERYDDISVYGRTHAEIARGAGLFGMDAYA